MKVTEIISSAFGYVADKLARRSIIAAEVLDPMLEELDSWWAPRINVKLDEGAYLPVRAHETDAGADIRTPCDFIVPGGGSATVHTGVHVQLPEGTVGVLKSKSGLNVRDSIVSEGVIDEGYSGEIVVKLYSNGDSGKWFEKGDKITQLLVLPVLYPEYVEVSEIEAGDRGDAGFGSTGR